MGKKKKKEKNSSFESLNGGSKLKNLTSAVKRKFEKSVSSPSLTKNLIADSDEPDETPKKKSKTDFEIGSILRKGIKFSSHDEYIKFMQPTADKKKEKRKKKKKQKREEERTEKDLTNGQTLSSETSKSDSANFN